jgi:hypothetical protein
MPVSGRWFDNPARIQSEGLWLAAHATDAEVLVRADAHTVYSSDYLRRSIEVLAESGATAVGGPMVPERPAGSDRRWPG